MDPHDLEMEMRKYDGMHYTLVPDEYNVYYHPCIGATNSTNDLNGSYYTSVPSYMPSKKRKTSIKIHIPTDQEILSQWNVPSYYRLEKIIGSGSYGSVAKAFDMRLNRDVAIKRVENVFCDLVDAQRILREIFILRHLNNPYIVKVLNVFATNEFPTNDEIYIVMEYMPFDLSKTLSSKQYWTEEPIRYIIFELIAGIEHLHRHKIIHRDLKPANLLLDTGAQLKICDFGLSRQIQTTESTMSSTMTMDIEMTSKEEDIPMSDTDSVMNSLNHRLTEHVYTRWYRAPEILLLCPYTEKIDIWGIGCIFAELLQMIRGNCHHYKSRRPLFPGTKCDLLSPGLEVNIPESERMEQLEMIYNTIGGPMNEYIEKVNRINGNHNIKPFSYTVDQINWKAMFPSCSEKGLHLLSQLLRIDPDERYTAKECLLHPYLYDLTVSKHLPCISIRSALTV